MSDFDFERAVAGLTGGYSAISALDQARLARSRDEEDYKRSNAELTMRQAAAERANRESDFDFGQKQGAAPFRRRQLELETDGMAHDFGEKQFAAPFKRQQLELETKGKADDVEGKRMKLDLERAENDPSSEYTKAMRGSLATQLRSFAARLGKSPDAALFSNAAEGIERNAHLGGAQLIGTVKPLADVAQINIRALHDDASAAETKRMHDAQIANMNADNDRAFEATVRKPQEKLNTEINNLETAASEMDELERVKEEVNTGPLTDLLYNTLGAGKIDELVPQKRKDLEALAARLFNKETKSLAGAAVSAAEWARIEPQIPSSKDDDATFKTKLARAKQETKRILDARRREYQQTPGGGVVDRSLVAQEANARAKPQMTAEDREALKWFNDPANKNDPARAGVAAVLRRKGVIK